MITVKKPKELDRFTDGEGNNFTIVSLYCPAEDNDSWVEYTKEATGQVYNCRLEAFLTRFYPTPN